MAALQDLGEQGGARVQGVLVILGKAQFAQPAQQELRALRIAGTLRQRHCDLVRERVEEPQRMLRRQVRLVLGGDPQSGFEQGGRVLGKAGKAGLTRVHGVLRLTLRL